MNKNHIAHSYDLKRLERHLERTSKYLQYEYETENRMTYTITELVLVLLSGTIAGFSLFLFVAWLDSVQPYPIITSIFFVLFIFGLAFILHIFFFHKASDLKHYSFFKKRFLKKNKALLSTLLGHYNLTIDNVDIDYKNLEISLKSKNKQK
jgi:hypothetical protein